MIKALIFALSFLGLLAGVIIASFTKEELKPGKKYFILLEKALLLAISIVIIFYVKDFFPFLILGVLASLAFRKVYFYFGLALPLAFENLLLLLSSLTFVFGMPYGTLLAKKSFKKEIIGSGTFFLAGILLAYFSNYKPLLMIIAGALLTISITDSKKFWIFPFKSFQYR